METPEKTLQVIPAGMWTRLLGTASDYEIHMRAGRSVAVDAEVIDGELHVRMRMDDVDAVAVRPRTLSVDWSTR